MHTGSGRGGATVLESVKKWWNNRTAGCQCNQTGTEWQNVRKKSMLSILKRPLYVNDMTGGKSKQGHKVIHLP